VGVSSCGGKVAFGRIDLHPEKPELENDV